MGEGQAAILLISAGGIRPLAQNQRHGFARPVPKEDRDNLDAMVNPGMWAVGLLTIVYLGLFPSIGAYACWNFGVSRAGAARATLFQYLIPVFAAVLAVLLLGEEVRLFHVAGAVLIIGGLLLATRAKAR
jgi:drug/metabolite transporter (DMT)-like permease